MSKLNNLKLPDDNPSGKSRVKTDDIEKNLTEWLGMELPKFEKNTFSDGSIEYILDLPRKVRYTFNIV